MSLKKARKLRDTLMILGIVIILLANLWTPLMFIGFAVALSCLIPDFLYNKCPHCQKHLGRSIGSFCPHCGEKID